MAVRIASRLILVLAGLALATTLVLGALSVLASSTPAEAAPLLERDHVAAVERAIEAPVDGEAADTTPTPAVVLVFAGIVLLAALPPAHRVHVYHRSSYHSDWI